MTTQARLGFVGLGPMGSDLMNQVAKNPRGCVAALCDLDDAALDKASAALGAAVPRFTDCHAMFAAGGLDGVVVAVPQYAHAEVSIAALEAGYTTFCEKPMAMNVRQCAAMIDAAKAAGKGLMIGQVLRYIDAYRYVLELATSGELGKAFAMRTTRTQGRWGNPWIQPWRLSYELCGGMLPEVNVHEIDLMLCILGDAVSVSAAGGHYANDQFDYEDVMTGHVTFANGGVGSVTSICCDWLGRHSAEIYLEKGTIYYDSLVNEVHVGKLGEEKRVLKYGQINPEWENGVYREMREFIETCLGEHDITIPGEQGIRGVEIAEAMYLSAREKRPVSLPLPRH